MSTTDLTDADYQALADFRHVLRRFLAFSEECAREVGLEPRQHQLLLALRGLRRDQPPTVTTLADRLVLRHNTVVELLDRLEALDLVRRTRDPEDRRRATVTITPRGLALLQKLTIAHRDELRSTGPSLVGALRGVLQTRRSR